MDKGPHIFGKGTVNPDTVFKFVATTLELSNVRASFQNKTMGLKIGAKRIQDIETAMIGLAQDFGISVKQWKEATAKVLAARKVQSMKLKPKLAGKEMGPVIFDEDTEIKVDALKE